MSYFNFYYKNFNNFFAESYFQNIIYKIILNLKPHRSDILDRNGEAIAKNISVYDVAVKPNFINDKKKFILKT